MLVVDDNATNRHILAEWLRGWQMDPTAVGDGMAAMDALWHRAANGRPYALVLLDARMPDADGLTVAAMIREGPELAATRIILLTSGERPGDPARVRELRIDAQLAQAGPAGRVARNDLPGDESVRATPAIGQAPMPRRQADPHQFLPAALRCTSWWPKIMSSTSQLLEQSLVRRGHRVRLASNGREALALAETGRLTCCSWTSTCRSWTASRSSRRSGSGS